MKSEIEPTTSHTAGAQTTTKPAWWFWMKKNNPAARDDSPADHGSTDTCKHKSGITLRISTKFVKDNNIYLFDV